MMPFAPLRAAGAALLLAACGSAAAAPSASFTVSGIADTGGGTNYDVAGWYSPTEAWGFGGGVGRIESQLGGSALSGSTWNVGTGLNAGRFGAFAGLRRWSGSGGIDSSALSLDAGWTWDNGVALTLLYEDRRLDVPYEVRALPGRPARTLRADFDGTGFGLDLSWYGEHWEATLRAVDYDYGSNVERARLAIASPQTLRFPAVQGLLQTILTSNVAAIDRDLLLAVGYRFERASLRADYLQQRDALTQQSIDSWSARYGFRFSDRVRATATLGVVDAGAGSTGFGGLSLTLSR